MKKKILTAIFVAIMVCLLSFTVSAANEVTLTDGTTVDLTTVFKVNEKNEVTGYNSGYTKDDITDVIFPDDIVGLESNFLFGEATNLNSVTFAATDTFFISGDNIFTKSSVKKITFNPDCVVELRKGNFSNCKSLTEITFPKFKKLAGSAFAYCENMVATNELVLAEGLTEIGGHAFQSCKSLTGKVVFPASLEKIQEYSFEKTGFSSFDLSKCSNLTVAGGGYGGPFTNNDNITTLDLSGCTSLTYLKGSFASNCDNLTSVILPPNLKTIEGKALAHCYKLQSIVLPATMETVADEAFHSARRGQSIMTFTVYIQSNVVMGASYPFRDSGAKIEYVLIGDNVTAESFIAANTFTGVTGATVVDYKDPQSPYTYIPGGTITSHTIVENYCKPLALTGEHQSEDNPCVMTCVACGLTSVKENPQHTVETTIDYENGYDKVGVKLIYCTNEGCKHSESEEAPALFVCLGYSASESGNAGLILGFKVNHEAIENYKTETGNALEYGMFAVLKSNIGENGILNADGSENAGVIKANLTKNQFAVVSMKVKGFTTDEQKDAQIALGLYVIVDGEEKEISYYQSGTPAEGEQFTSTSYNRQVSVAE